MLTFLFWNMGGKRQDRRRHAFTHHLQSILANLVRANNVDILMLAEQPDFPDLLRALNLHLERFGRFHTSSPSLCEAITVVTRFSARFARPKEESPRYTARVVRLPGRPSFLLFVVHLASKMYRKEPSQTLSLGPLANSIRFLERKLGHRRTILVGDLNMNPFEDGIIGAETLNAVMTREVAQRRERTVDSVRYPFFYNPMWSLFGDATHEAFPPGNPGHEPAGTCYYPPSESRWFYWNMFDQVLIRPELLPYFKSGDLKIVVTDGETSFVNERGIPTREQVSDHLPILFRLNI